MPGHSDSRKVGFPGRLRLAVTFSCPPSRQSAATTAGCCGAPGIPIIAGSTAVSRVHRLPRRPRAGREAPTGSVT